MIRITCSQCGKTIKAPDQHAGKKGRCPNCGNTIVLSVRPEPPQVQLTQQEVQSTPEPVSSIPDPVPSAPKPVSVGNRKVLIIGIASLCAVAIVVVGLGFFLGWFGDGLPELSPEVLDPKPGLPTAGAPELSPEVLDPKAGLPTAGAAELLGKLDRIAQAADDTGPMRQKIKKVTWKIHAAFGDTANAIIAHETDDDTGKLDALMYVLESARRRGDKGVADKAADNGYALALKVQEDPDKKLNADLKREFLLVAAGGYAVAGNSGRFREVMARITFAGKDEVKRDRFLERILDTLNGLDDPAGALAVLEQMSANRYMSKRLDVVRALAARSDKAAAAKYYRARLDGLVAGSKAGGSTRTLRDCLKAMCETGLFDQAAEGVIALPEAHSDRFGLLASVAMCQADSGDAEGAAKNARRGGDLLLAAELALDAGKKQQAADDALHVYAVLPALPKSKSGSNRPTRGDSAPAMRVALLKRIAVVLLRANKEREGRIILNQARKIVAEGSDRDFDRLMWVLASAENVAARHRLADGDVAAARRAAKIIKAIPGSEACLPEMYTNIGVALWKDGKKVDAAAAFAKAVAACMDRASQAGLGPVAAARARVGDVDGAVKTLALPKNSRVEDSDLGDIAVAQIHAGDPNGALETIASVRMYSYRYTNILRRITDAVAQRGDLEGAFRMFLANARTVGPRMPEPIELAARAIDDDKGDLLQRYYRPIRAKSLAPLARKAVDAGKAELAQALLERGLEHLAGLSDPYSNRSEIIATILLMAEYGDKAKALNAMRATMALPVASERKALQSVPIAVNLMLRIGSVDDVLAWAAKTPYPRHRAVILKTAMDALVGSVLIPRGPQKRPSPAKVSAATMIFNRHGDSRNSLVQPPHIAPGSKRPAVRLVEAPPQTGTWTVQRILANARRSRNAGSADCAVCVKDGNPMIFFFDVPAGQRTSSVMRVYKTGETWKQEEVARPEDKESYFYFDAATIAGVPHVAMNSNETSGDRRGSLEIRALRDGKWTTVFENRRVGSHYGRRVAIGSLAGRAVAAYTDVYPQSGGWSKNAKFLEQGADGKWTELRLSMPRIGGIVHLDIGQVGQDAALVISTTGAFGKFKGLRLDGKWTFDKVGPRLLRQDKQEDVLSQV